MINRTHIRKPALESLESRQLLCADIGCVDVQMLDQINVEQEIQEIRRSLSQLAERLAEHAPPTTSTLNSLTMNLPQTPLPDPDDYFEQVGRDDLRVDEFDDFELPPAPNFRDRIDLPEASDEPPVTLLGRGGLVEVVGLHANLFTPSSSTGVNSTDKHFVNRVTAQSEPLVPNNLHAFDVSLIPTVRAFLQLQLQGARQ